MVVVVRYTRGGGCSACPFEAAGVQQAKTTCVDPVIETRSLVASHAQHETRAAMLREATLVLVI